jgi:hypothetical protein
MVAAQPPVPLAATTFSLNNPGEVPVNVSAWQLVGAVDPASELP